MLLNILYLIQSSGTNDIVANPIRLRLTLVCTNYVPAIFGLRTRITANTACCAWGEWKMIVITLTHFL